MIIETRDLDYCKLLKSIFPALTYCFNLKYDLL